MKYLKINKNFRSTLPKLSRQNYKNLEEDILRHGCRTPIEVEDGIIINGHHRYEICQKHGLPFKTRRIS